MTAVNSRYEIVYKNFLKDMRKFYIEELSKNKIQSQTDFEAFHLKVFKFLISSNLTSTAIA